MTDNDNLRVLKTGTCPSLSGKSKLTYEIGCGPAGDVHLRVAKNSGSGYFSKDWISGDELRRVLERNDGRPITFHTLGPLYAGKSINTAGFLLAVLKQEGVVGALEDKRGYQRLDASAFAAEIKKLLEGVGVGAAAPKTSAKKPGAGAKAPSRRR